MKNSLKSLFIALMFLSFISFAQVGLAQEPPHPPSEKGTSNNQSPANAPGAPVGSGLTILLVMAAAYGAFKLRQVSSKVSATE